MFKSYVPEVWLSMKFHFIRRCPWEQRNEMLGACLPEAGPDRGSPRPPRVPVCAAEMPQTHSA